MEPEAQSLIEMLAITDAVFAPVRGWTRGNRIALQMRALYPTRGITMQAEGDAAGRKRAERLRSALEARGLITMLRFKKGRTSGVKLTDAGEAKARRLAGLPPMSEAVPVLQKLLSHRAEAENANPRAVGYNSSIVRTYISERTILPEYDPAKQTIEERQKLVRLEEKLLPALIRSFCYSASNRAGQIWYGIPDKIADAASIPEFGVKKDEYPKYTESDELTLYYQTFESTRAEFEMMEAPMPREIADASIELQPR